MKKIKRNNQDIYIDCLEFMCESYALQIKKMQHDIYWLLHYLQRNLKYEENERIDKNDK